MSASDEEGSDLEDLIARLRRELKASPVLGAKGLPQRSSATEALVDDTDIAEHQAFGERARGLGVCDDEGWYWSPGWGNSGDIPWSVWCGRPQGHGGPHQARTGFTLRGGRIKVLQWPGRDAAAGADSPRRDSHPLESERVGESRSRRHGRLWQVADFWRSRRGLQGPVIALIALALATVIAPWAVTGSVVDGVLGLAALGVLWAVILVPVLIVVTVRGGTGRKR